MSQHPTDTALRAWLAIRRGELVPAGWTVSVHRDLNDLRETWAARDATRDAAGLVHVGFSPIDPTAVEAALRTATGGDAVGLWLTAAAKYSLPQSFSTGAFAVTVIDGMPVFAATAGWATRPPAAPSEGSVQGQTGAGAASDDGEGAPTDAVEEAADVRETLLGYPFDDAASATEDAGTVQPVGTAPSAVGPPDPLDAWLDALATARPAERADLAAAGIDDDGAYWTREAALPGAVRGTVGAFRMRALAGEWWFDPTVLALTAPPWLVDHRFTATDVSTRTFNATRNAGIVTVGDLARWHWDRLISVRTLSPQSVADLADALGRLAQAGPLPAAPHVPVSPEPATLRDALDAALAEMPERQRLVFTMRIGLDGEPRTLQDISTDFGVTRERIRQIESKVIRLLRGAVWSRPLTERLSWLLEGRDEPLPVADLAGLDSWFSGLEGHTDALDALLRWFTDRSVNVVEIDGQSVVSTISSADWALALTGARALLESDEAIGTTEDDCRDRVAGCLPPGADELAGTLWRLASANTHFGADAAGERVLIAHGRGAEPIVAAVLAEAETPLHFSEVARRASARTGRPMDERRAHNVLSEIGLLFGRGTFGTDRHLPLSTDDLRALADAALEVVLDDGSDRQWHVDELLLALGERGLAPAPEATRYVLEIALNRAGDLERLRRFVWRAPSGGEGAAERINLRETVIALLREAGHPMPMNELRERVTARRGLSRYFQIQVAEPLIRVAPGTWGLIDRDLPLDVAGRDELIAGIVTALRQDEVGLHLSEVPGRVGQPVGVTSETVASLAILDPRLRLSRGDYLSLAGWEGPRRLTPSEAVAAVIAAAAGPLPFDEVVSEAVYRLGRPVERFAVSAALRDVGAVSTGDGRWMAAGSAATLGDDEDEPDPAG